MWNLIKKIWHFITTVLLYSVYVLLFIVGVCVILYFVDQKKAAASGQARPPLFGAYVIISNSMVPNINIDDAVLTARLDSSKINKGDVITFISTDVNHSGITITHRVVGITTTADGKVAYRTKGDNNNTEDSTLVNYEDVLGKVMLRVPYIGKLQKLLSTSYGWILLIVVPCVLIIISDIFKIFKNIAFGDNNKEVENKQEIGTNIDNKPEDNTLESTKNNTDENTDEFL